MKRAVIWACPQPHGSLPNIACAFDAVAGSLFPSGPAASTHAQIMLEGDRSFHPRLFAGDFTTSHGLFNAAAPEALLCRKVNTRQVLIFASTSCHALEGN